MAAGFLFISVLFLGDGYVWMDFPERLQIICKLTFLLVHVFTYLPLTHSKLQNKPFYVFILR